MLGQKLGLEEKKIDVSKEEEEKCGFLTRK